MFTSLTLSKIGSNCRDARSLECVLFIAAEFFENGDDDKWAGKNISKLPTDTCIVRVDENFHYGQGFLKGHRFVVYHPTNRKEMKQVCSIHPLPRSSNPFQIISMSVMAYEMLLLGSFPQQ